MSKGKILIEQKRRVGVVGHEQPTGRVGTSETGQYIQQKSSEGTNKMTLPVLLY
jgi:hypothetical protein